MNDREHMTAYVDNEIVINQISILLNHCLHNGAAAATLIVTYPDGRQVKIAGSLAAPGAAFQA